MTIFEMAQRLGAEKFHLAQTGSRQAVRAEMKALTQHLDPKIKKRVQRLAEAEFKKLAWTATTAS